MKISAPAPDKNPGSSNPGIHPQNIGYDWFSYSFGRFSWYLGFFLLDPDPYQSSPWIRIRNKFFHILDPYQKWYGSATLVLGSKIKIKELHVKFSVFIYESKRTSAQKMYRYHIFTSQTERGGNMLLPVMQIRIILIRIWMRIQDVKKFVTDKDPDPRWTLIQIRIQEKTKRIRIQQKRTMYQENLQKVYKKRT